MLAGSRPIIGGVRCGRPQGLQTRYARTSGGVARRWGAWRSCPAFTLIEMVVSLSVVSIVFMAMGSVMMMATHAIPTPDAPASLMIDAADILEQMASELQVATAVTAATDKGITFTVPDRDNDAVDETISYLWDGTAGTPFCRRYNGGAWVAGMPGIRGFKMAYETLEISTPGDPVTSDEVVLVSHDPAQKSMDYSVNNTKWVGQCIAPLNLPADATDWAVTRLLFRAKSKGGASGVSMVQMQTANADGTPTGTVLEEYTLSESGLANGYAWQAYTFNSVAGIDPGDKLCLVIRWVNDTDACVVKYDNSSGGGFLKTANAGGSWSVDSGKSLVFYTYGTYTSPGPEVTTYKLRSVSMTLAPGSDAASQARASAVALNRPQMP